MFLAHVVDITSSMHAPFVFRSLASKPFATKLILVPLWPIAFVHMIVMWAKSKTFLISFYKLRGHLHQTWAVPRFGFHVTFIFFWFLLLIIYPLILRIYDIEFYLIWVLNLHVLFFHSLVQYFLPFASDGINNLIEAAILRADKLGVKVISLAALNKVFTSSTVN